jgi:hypothetical protein
MCGDSKLPTLKPAMPAHLTVRALKVTVVLDPAELLLLDAAEGKPRLTLRIRVGGERLVTAELAAKSVRKAQAAIREHGAAGVAVVLQGKLVAGDQITEVGLSAQVKQPRPAVETVAA